MWTHTGTKGRCKGAPNLGGSEWRPAATTCMAVWHECADSFPSIHLFMNTSILKKKSVWGGLLLLGAALVLVACGGGGGTTDEKSDPVAQTEREQAQGLFDRLPVSWIPTKIVTDVGLGAPVSIPVTLTTTKALTNARIVFVPDLRKAVTVSPEVIPSLPAGQSATVTLTFQPKTTDTRKYIAGVVLLFDKNATVSRPLPVRANLLGSGDWTVASSAQTVGISAKVPPNWYAKFNDRARRLSLQNIDVIGPPSTEAFAREAVFRVVRRKEANPSQLSIEDWVTERLVPALPTPIASRTSLVVSGKPSVRIVYSEIGGDTVHIYLPSGRDIVEVSYGIFTSALVPGYEEILKTLAITDS